MNHTPVIRVTVWSENRHEATNPSVARNYPWGMHECIAAGLRESGRLEVRTATLDEPEHGLTIQTLDTTDVLIWWGHLAHAEVADTVAARVQARVREGMGLIVLHSAHCSKVFTGLLGCSGALAWRDSGERERIWVCNPGHPIAEGLGRYFEIPREEMYCEPFGIPNPDEVVFISHFEGGEVIRSGCCFRQGNGKIFYFRPGHETFPTFHQAEVKLVLQNACRWAAPQGGKWLATFPNVPMEQAPDFAAKLSTVR